MATSLYDSAIIPSGILTGLAGGSGFKFTSLLSSCFCKRVDSRIFKSFQLLNFKTKILLAVNKMF